MAVEKMYLVNMISDMENLDEFLEDVIKIGDIEPVDAFSQVTNRTFNIKATAENVDITEDINNISGFNKDNDGYIDKLRALKKALNVADNPSGQVADKDRVNELYDKLNTLLKEKEELEEKAKRLDTYKRNIEILKNYNIDIEKIQNLNYFDYRYGQISEDGRFILKNNYENIPSLIIHLDENVDQASLKALEEIYSLDEATKNLNDQTEKILENERSNTRNVNLELEKEYSKESKDKSKEIYDEIMKEAHSKSIEINRDYQSRINYMNQIYKEHKDDIVDKVVEFLVDTSN